MTIGYSDMNTLQEFLKILNLSLINSSSEIISSETTTGKTCSSFLSFIYLLLYYFHCWSCDAVLSAECTSDLTQYQCSCRENYAWSNNTCMTYGACNGSYTGDTCGCIKGRPKYNESCQLNLSTTGRPRGFHRAHIWMHMLHTFLFLQVNVYL